MSKCIDKLTGKVILIDARRESGPDIQQFGSPYDVVYELLGHGVIGQVGPWGYGNEAHKQALDQLECRIAKVRKDIAEVEVQEQEWAKRNMSNHEQR